MPRMKRTYAMSLLVAEDKWEHENWERALHYYRRCLELIDEWDLDIEEELVFLEQRIRRCEYM